jgi:integrase
MRLYYLTAGAYLGQNRGKINVQQNLESFMPRLTEVQLRAIKPTGEIKRYHDEHGLYLEVSKAGGKYWRRCYQFDGKEKRLSLGAWPEVSLKEAREKSDEARRLLKSGADPSVAKKMSVLRPEGPTFREVADEWRANRGNVWAATHAATVESRLRLFVYPEFGDQSIREIAPTDVLAMLRKIETRQALETASRTLGICSMVFRYGVGIGAVSSDPCRDLRGVLVPHKSKPFAALTRPKDVGVLMLAIDGYMGSAVVHAALLFSALVFCRPGEVRHAEWREIDIDAKEWIIPGEKMKGGREHRVPLSRQALDVLLGIREITGDGKYVFPSQRGASRPLSENGVRVALRTMGYDNTQMTPHGFRAMASTLLNELGCRADVIEAQLAHKSSDKIRAIYNRAQYMEERRQLMQQWADYLDSLRSLAAHRHTVDN